MPGFSASVSYNHNQLRAPIGHRKRSSQPQLLLLYVNIYIHACALTAFLKASTTSRIE